MELYVTLMDGLKETITYFKWHYSWVYYNIDCREGFLRFCAKNCPSALSG
jgi:hypothetical protein